MGIATTKLTPIEQTAFLTEYARALDSQWTRPILGDALAHEVVGKIDYDFAGLGVANKCGLPDGAAREDASSTGSATSSNVIPMPSWSISAPVSDSGFYRVAPPQTVDWYSVDLPGITAVRDQVLPAAPQSHSVPVSLADEHWPDSIPADRPTMLIADGLFAFLTESMIEGNLPPNHRPLRLRRAGVQRLRPHRLGEPRGDQALPAEDVRRRRQPIRLPRVQRRTPPRDLEPANAIGRGGQPHRCSRSRLVPRLDQGGHQSFPA